jgi:membrane protease YdiL (CAAX protease family)
VETAEAPRRQSWRLVAWLLLSLAFAGLAYAGQLSDEEPPDDYAYRYSSSVGAAVVYAVTFGLLLLIARGLDRRAAFGLRAPASWPRALGLALLALLAIYVLTAIYVAATNADPSDEQGLVPTEWDSSRIVPFALFFVSVAVFAPVVEELTYRGLGFSLFAPFGTWTAIIVTGLLFGAAHGLFVAFPILALFGIVVGWLRARTASVYPGMLLHGLFNAVAVIVSVSG